MFLHQTLCFSFLLSSSSNRYHFVYFVITPPEFLIDIIAYIDPDGLLAKLSG